ncbi:unnamed protein product [Trichobilharzia regenti]|nr:unnamed protein product [Trichobilharzia regenti]
MIRDTCYNNKLSKGQVFRSTLKATDKDVNSTITYTMENGVDLNATMKFLIESNGKVIVQEQLDYEECNSYSFTVRASDGEFFALAKLIVIIVDVNDEPPEYVLNPNPLVIMENKPARTLIGHVSCLLLFRFFRKVNKTQFNSVSEQTSFKKLF